MKRVAAAGTVLVLGVALTAVAEPTGRDINPGVLGPNALPVLPNESPLVTSGLQVSLGWAGQLSTPNGAPDLSMLLPFRLEVGLLERVAFVADGAPFELWQYSTETNVAWAPSRSRGITRADVRLGTKVLLWREAGLRPAAALRVTLKTATGEDLFTRRFIDAPAYQFDALTRWHWLAGLTRLEAWLSVGFLAWQQGAAGQNDAFTWAGTVRASWAHVAARLEARGFVGWLRFDAPVVLSTLLELHLTPQWTVMLHATRTFRDPPGLELGVMARLLIPTDER